MGVKEDKLYRRSWRRKPRELKRQKEKAKGKED